MEIGKVSDKMKEVGLIMVIKTYVFYNLHRYMQVFLTILK